MLRIRLRRTGRKNQPFFQMVVMERSGPPKGGRAKEIVGFFDPVTKKRNVKEERVKYWLSVGAQPSDTVHNLLVAEGIIEGDKKPVHTEPSKEPEEEEEKKELEKKAEPDSEDGEKLQEPEKEEEEEEEEEEDQTEEE